MHYTEITAVTKDEMTLKGLPRGTPRYEYGINADHTKDAGELL